MKPLGTYMYGDIVQIVAELRNERLWSHGINIFDMLQIFLRKFH